MPRLFFLLSSFILLVTSSFANDPERDFSGRWLLDRAAGNFRDLTDPPDSLTVTQTDSAIECTAGRERWVIQIENGDSKYRVAGDT